MRLRINNSQVRELFKDIDNLPTQVMSSAGTYFKSITPIDKGNARRNTKRTGLVINADYAYAARLDDGYSQQARGGMVNPTIDFIDREVDKHIGRM